MRDIFNERERPVTTVHGDTLDNLLAKIAESFTRDIAVVWIDVQGYEGYVFKGACELLSTGIPVVAEIWPYGIARTGMTIEEFNELVTGIWSSFWVRRDREFGPKGFIRYPIVAFSSFLEELGPDGGADNVIFTLE